MRPDQEDKQTAISAYEKLHQYILNFCNDKNCLGCPFAYGGAIGSNKKSQSFYCLIEDMNGELKLRGRK